MIFAKCIELKKLIAKYNRVQSVPENCLRYEFGMFMDGEWSCTLKSNGCIGVHDFQPIYDFIATLYVEPFMYGSRFGFRVHIQ